MTQTALEGYHFYSRPYPHAPGCTHLDVALRAEPSRQHFDPEKIHFTAVSPAGDIVPMMVTLSTVTGPEPTKVCAGRIVLIDRLDKRVQFLTLGGCLGLTRQDDGLLCRFSSPAPMVELALTRDAPELLAEEIEDILARRRAFWEGRRGEFERRLAAARPETLYQAILAALAEQLDAAGRAHGSFEEDAGRLARFVDEEREALSDSPAGEVRLEDLL